MQKLLLRSEKRGISVACKRDYKKIVFVIVEGASEYEALGAILTNFYDKNTVRVEVMHGDITSDNTIRPDQIVAKVGNTIKKYANSMHFKKNDFQEIIHLVDTDGAFIADNCVKENPTAIKPVYTLCEILTNKPDMIKERNAQKRQKLNRLSSLKETWDIPYSIFYMSCNLDHVLYDKQNNSEVEKETDAHAFAAKHRNNIKEFLTFIKESEFSVIGEYADSWNFIKQGNHSLERHSNFGICFKNRA